MYDGIKLFLTIVGYFFIAYLIGYSTFLFLSVIVGSLDLYKRNRQEKFKSILPTDYYLPISIIVPAHNEEITVVDTVRSLLALDYHSYEIIVVDDGSSDATSEVLAEAFDMHVVHRPIRRRIECRREERVYETSAQKVPLTLIRKENGGKADALNMGINASTFPYFICMDADSVLQYDSLRRIAQPVAVGGIVRISNDVELENGRVKRYRLPRSILAFMQVLEYDRSFLASRILFDRFNGSLIISGAFGLFKKDTVIAVGGWLIMKGQMDYVGLITFSLYITTFISPVRKLANFAEMFSNGFAGLHRFIELMATEPTELSTRHTATTISAAL